MRESRVTDTVRMRWKEINDQLTCDLAELMHIDGAMLNYTALDACIKVGALETTFNAVCDVLDEIGKDGCIYEINDEMTIPRGVLRDISDN